jgi:formate/nitrite transporter FocA (FNT family)
MGDNRVAGKQLEETPVTSLQALGICAGISIALSIVLLITIAAPLRSFIQRLCPGPEAVGFWSRFTLVMLFLSPLFVAVAFGLPSGQTLEETDVGEQIQRAVTTSIIGAFLAMLGIGLWVSSLMRRAPLPPR